MLGLVQLKQRIKAIQTIKKITHAMRIVSMSTHARLRNQQQTLKEYKETLTLLYGTITKQAALEEATAQTDQPSIHTKKGITLFIIVGSQKGLCGNFNNNLFHYVHQPLQDVAGDYEVISVGKKTHDYLVSIGLTPHTAYDEFTSLQLNSLTKSLTDTLLSDEKKYSEVILFSMTSQSFFNQKPHRTDLLPFQAPEVQTAQLNSEYRWEDSTEELVAYCTKEILATKIYEALLRSLIAEQAARFIAMDNSTRNAANLLDAMTLRYNKTRQSKITRELTDLASSF